MLLRSTQTLFLTAALLLGQAAMADDFAAQADQALARIKPGLTDDVIVAQDKCHRLSAESPNRVLVIAFEGLASFSEASTVQAYRYQWELAHHLPATAPGFALNGFVVRETLTPAISARKGSFEFLAFPYTAELREAASVPERCALEWMRKKGRHLVIVGHSFGGDSAVQLLEQLRSRNVTVDVALTIDPVPQAPRPESVIHVTRNVRRWENFFQRVMLPMGVSLPEAAVNRRLSVVHTAVPAQPEVVQSLLAALGQLSLH